MAIVSVIHISGLSSESVVVEMVSPAVFFHGLEDTATQDGRLTLPAGMHCGGREGNPLPTVSWSKNDS